MSNSDAPPPTEWQLSDRTEFRAALRNWLAQHWNASLTLRQWWALLGDAGLSTPTWPKAFGGLAATTAVQAIIEEELAAAGAIAPPQGGLGVRIAAPTLREHASLTQCDELLRPLGRGETSWCLLIDEYTSGGEPMAITTKAIVDRRGRYWVDGAKQRVVGAATADRGLLIARTTVEPDADPRRGLSCFVYDMTSPGTELLDQDGDTMTVVFDQVSLSENAMIGEPGSAWQIAKTAGSYAGTSLSGRIRRGLVEVASGELAGNLDRTGAEVLAEARRDAPEGDAPERRRER